MNLTKSNTPPNSPGPNCKLTGPRGILECLAKDPTHASDAKTISEATGIPKATVYIYLSRLYKDGKITKPVPGLYQFNSTAAVPRLQDLQDIRFHHIHLTRNPTHPPPDLTGQEGAGQGVPSSVYEVVTEGRGWQVKVRTGTSPEVVIAASEAPLTPSQLVMVLEQLASRQGWDFEKEGWTVSSLDVNLDTQDMRLDGLNCVTYTDLEAVLYKAYNKKGRLRVEAALGADKVSMSEVLRFLKGQGTGGLTALRAEQAQLREEITLTRKELGHLSRAVRKLLDEVHGRP